MEKEVIRDMRKRYSDLMRLSRSMRDKVVGLTFKSLYLDGAPIVDSKLIDGKKVLKII